MSRILDITILVCLFVLMSAASAGQSLPPGHSTECTIHSGSPACQNPVYTDNLSEYLYDLRTSWTFNNGAPDDSGPTVFEGGSAGNLSQQSNDTVTSPNKTEYFIQNPGEAGTFNFGRGDVQNTSIQITGSKTGSNTLGEYLINPPHQGECGDGIDDGEDPSDCPQDKGLPDERIRSSDKDITFDSSGTIDVSLPDDDAPNIVTHVPGTKSNSPDYHLNKQNSYIYKDTVGHERKDIGTITHHYKSDSSQLDDYSENEAEATYYTGDKSTTSKNYCVTASEVSEKYLNGETSFTDGGNLKHTGPNMKYDAVDNDNPGTAKVKLDYNKDFTGKHPNTCDSSVGYDVDCEKSDNYQIDYNELKNSPKKKSLSSSEPGFSEVVVTAKKYSGGPDYRNVSGDIYKETLDGPTTKTIGTVEHHWKEDDGTVKKGMGEKAGIQTYKPGNDGVDSYLTEETLCTVNNNNSVKNSIDLSDPVTETLSSSSQGEEYRFGKNQSKENIKVKFENLKKYVNSTNWEDKCANWKTVYTDCSDSGNIPPGDSCNNRKNGTIEAYEQNETVDVKKVESKEITAKYEDYKVQQEADPVCESKTLDYHAKETEDAGVHEISTKEYTFTYDDYWINRQKIWGPVNSNQKQIFPSYTDLTVKDSSFGYHAVPDKPQGQGSNDPSVSANRFQLKDTGSHIVAENVQHYVADADGPNGESNGLIAYNEESGTIEGYTKNLFKTELWQGSSNNYITKSDLPGLNCQGNSIRCLKSVDVRTNGTNWSDDPEDSFAINIEN